MKKMAKVILTILGIITYLFAAWWFVWRDSALFNHRAPELTETQKVYFKERFKFHGIGGAICEGKNCYFYRQGVKCKL